MRLLLVEDHPELSHWLQKALTGAGFAVDVAPDGVAADHLLLNERYALAVLDVALPRMNGLDLLARLRKRGQDLPVLLLTARTDVADRVKGLNLGRTITSPSRSNWTSWKRASGRCCAAASAPHSRRCSTAR